MDVKEAVTSAKRHVFELFSDETPTNIGLEEVEFDEANNNWLITIGFTRPWEAPANTFTALTAAAFPHRSYKLVRISNDTGRVLSVKNREERS